MDGFILSSGTWRSWQMLPGYFGERMTPFCSPIYVRAVEALKSGKGLLRISFFNALYAEGAQEFELELKVIKRASNYLIVDLPYDSERSAVVGHIEFSWLRTYCPGLVSAHPPDAFSSVSLYLDSVFAPGGACQLVIQARQ